MAEREVIKGRVWIEIHQQDSLMTYEFIINENKYLPQAENVVFVLSILKHFIRSLYSIPGFEL